MRQQPYGGKNNTIYFPPLFSYLNEIESQISRAISMNSGLRIVPREPRVFEPIKRIVERQVGDEMISKKRVLVIAANVSLEIVVEDELSLVFESRKGKIDAATKADFLVDYNGLLVVGPDDWQCLGKYFGKYDGFNMPL